MSESNDWESMLRAVLGDEAADRIIASMRAQGIDPSSQQLPGMDTTQMGVVMNQIRSMLGSAGEGPVNWQVGEQVARQTIIREGADTVTGSQGDGARSALQTASLWLDPVTAIGPVLGPVQAWSRLDVVAHSLPTFRKLTDPVGANVARAFGEAMRHQLDSMPPELRGVMGGEQISQSLSAMIASMLGVQYGVGLAELARVTFGTADAGIPLVEGQTAALVPSNISEWGAELDADDDEVLLYAAVREQAVARLYSRVPWLSPSVIDSVAAYASDIEIDTSSIEEQVSSMQFDPQAMSTGSMPEIDLTDVFNPAPTESQRATLARLEHLISLVEGWVATVAASAVAAQLPHAVPLAEMFTRRSASEAPSTRVFGPLIGFQLAPRSVREAARFWQLATSKLGVEGRDALWNHPDLLPTAEDLDNPEAFFASDSETDLDAELDSFLSEVLDGSSDDDAPHEPEFGAGAGEGEADGEPGNADNKQ